MSNRFPDPLSRPSRQAYESQVWAEFFGDLLRSAREQRSLSLEEAGRRAGMTASQWEAIEAGRVPTNPGPAPGPGRQPGHRVERHGRRSAALPAGLGGSQEGRRFWPAYS